MGQVLHGSATTTEAIRRATQRIPRPRPPKVDPLRSRGGPPLRSPSAIPRPRKRPHQRGWGIEGGCLGTFATLTDTVALCSVGGPAETATESSAPCSAEPDAYSHLARRAGFQLAGGKRSAD